jgi:RimJ/RimL family protein N-acetyltransferase
MFIIEPLQDCHIVGVQLAFDVVAREGRYFSVDAAIPLEPFADWVISGRNAGSPQLVACSYEGVIGWCIVQRQLDPAMRHAGSLFMGLLPHWRGRGVGNQILRATLASAWRNGITRVYLDVYTDNEAAIQLYRSCGFVSEGIKRNAHLCNGRYRDVLTMALLADSLETADREQQLQVEDETKAMSA